MSEWTTWRLGEVADVFDGPHATPKKTSDGPWYLSISSLVRGRLDLSQSAHLSEKDLPRWTRRVAPQRGDTLFSYETRIGEAAHWSLDEPAALGRRMGILRPKECRVDPRFLTLAYLSPQFQEVIRLNTVHGATVERLLISKMPNWIIELPPLDEQKRIASLLGGLDDLIEAELGIAAVADALWRCVVEGGGDRDEVRLSDLADFVNGRNFTNGASGTGLPVIRTPEVRSGPSDATVLSDIDADPVHLADPGDILFVWSGSLLVDRWVWGTGLINQHIFKVIPHAGVPGWLAHWAVEHLMEDFLVSHGTRPRRWGTSSAAISNAWCPAHRGIAGATWTGMSVRYGMRSSKREPTRSS